MRAGRRNGECSILIGIEEPSVCALAPILRRLFAGSLLPPISFYLWDRPARINRRVRLIWPLILISDSTQEPNCSYSPLRHIGHFDPVFLSQFFQNLEVICRRLLHASHLHQKLSGTIKPLPYQNRSDPNRSPPDHPAFAMGAEIGRAS